MWMSSVPVYRGVRCKHDQFGPVNVAFHLQTHLLMVSLGLYSLLRTRKSLTISSWYCELNLAHIHAAVISLHVFLLTKQNI